MWWIIGIAVLLVGAGVAWWIIAKAENAKNEEAVEQRPDVTESEDDVEVITIANGEGLAAAQPWARTVVEDGDQEIAIRRRPVVVEEEEDEQPFLPDFAYLYDNPPVPIDTTPEPAWTEPAPAYEPPAQRDDTSCTPAPDLGDHRVDPTPAPDYCPAPTPDPTPSSTDYGPPSTDYGNTGSDYGNSGSSYDGSGGGSGW